MRKERIIVSACLWGINCRYDNEIRTCKKILQLAEKFLCIPVCPEQLGGLSTPRNPSYISKGNGFEVLRGKTKVLTFKGKDVTHNFFLGAQEALKIAQLTGCTHAILKEKSPSCGVNYIYQKEKLVKGCGVTTALLLKNGFSVRSEVDVN
ncbi:MAG: DUF523 domain-containing protein [bacterium]